MQGASFAHVVVNIAYCDDWSANYRAKGLELGETSCAHLRERMCECDRAEIQRQVCEPPRIRLTDLSPGDPQSDAMFETLQEICSLQPIFTFDRRAPCTCDQLAQLAVATVCGSEKCHSVVAF